MKNIKQLLLPIFLIGLLFTLNSCCAKRFGKFKIKDKENINADIMSNYDLSFAGTGLIEVQMAIKARINDDDPNSFLIDIELTGANKANASVKFIQIPHHPINVYDDKVMSAIGLIEVIDISTLDDNKIKYVPEKKIGEKKTYSINIKKERLQTDSNGHAFGSILIFSPQSIEHDHSKNEVLHSHTKDGIVKDPR